MIKKLISDISYDKVSMTQALTRAKVIAYQIDNDEFKNWINRELNGYENEESVPNYRQLSCEIFAQLDDIYHGTRIVPIDLSSINDQVDWDIYQVKHTGSISSVEENYLNSESSNETYGYIDFPIKMMISIQKMTQRYDISAIKRKLQFSQLGNILNMTKQLLLDTLLELNKAFPNLKDDYMIDEEKKEVAKQIITNIYGNNASSNVGVGHGFTQGISNSYTEKVEQVLNNLRKLGVPDENIDELKDIINNEPDKSKLGTKFLAWSSALMTKAIETGIDVKVPEVLDAIQNLVV